jgi:hypothetical protein
MGLPRDEAEISGPEIWNLTKPQYISLPGKLLIHPIQ